MGGNKLVGRVKVLKEHLADVVVSNDGEDDVVHTVQVRLLSKHDPTKPLLPHQLSIHASIKQPAVNFAELGNPLMEQFATQFLTHGYALHQRAGTLVNVYAFESGDEPQVWQARAEKACDVNELVLFPYGVMAKIDEGKVYKRPKTLHACLMPHVLAKCFTGDGDDVTEFIIKSPLPMTQKSFEATPCAAYWAVQHLDEDSDSDTEGAGASAVNMVRKEVKISVLSPDVEYSGMKFKKLKKPTGKKAATFVFSTTVLTNKTELALGDVLVVAKKIENVEAAAQQE